MQGVTGDCALFGWRATEPESSTQALTLLSPSTSGFKFYFICLLIKYFFCPTPIESQIQLGPRNRGDDPRFLLLGLHHHPDSGRLHRVAAGSQQVTRWAGPGSGAWSVHPQEGQRSPSRVGNSCAGLLIPWCPFCNRNCGCLLPD